MTGPTEITSSCFVGDISCILAWMGMDSGRRKLFFQVVNLQACTLGQDKSRRPDKAFRRRG